MAKIGFQEALQIENLDPLKMQSLEENISRFEYYKELMLEHYPRLEDWGAAYWAITMLRLELAGCGEPRVWLDPIDSAGSIVIIIDPDTGS